LEVRLGAEIARHRPALPFVRRDWPNHIKVTLFSENLSGVRRMGKEVMVCAATNDVVGIQTRDSARNERMLALALAVNTRPTTVFLQLTSITSPPPTRRCGALDRGDRRRLHNCAH
jgi:hypothetical protein